MRSAAQFAVVFALAAVAVSTGSPGRDSGSRKKSAISTNSWGGRGDFIGGSVGVAVRNFDPERTPSWADWEISTKAHQRYLVSRESSVCVACGTRVRQPHC